MKEVIGDDTNITKDIHFTSRAENHLINLCKSDRFAEDYGINVTITSDNPLKNYRIGVIIE